jgi:two-component system, NtrC family, response regulator AtoC
MDTALPTEERRRVGEVESDELKLLVSHWIERFNRQHGKQVRGLSPSAVDRLRTRYWPGNLRALRDAVEQAVAQTHDEVLTAEHFPHREGEEEAQRDTFVLPPEGIDLEEVEKSLVRQALERSSGNRTRAGALLGLTRDQVRYRIQKYTLDQ